jgi:hypothetical protein
VADVFVSYKRVDQPTVRRLVDALRSQGLAVWWDQDIPPDAAWEATIETELEAARSVVVAWSEAAVVSDNVKAEARRASRQGKLIQVFLQVCEAPLFFGERQGVDLVNWSGAADDPRFVSVADAVRAVLAGKGLPAREIEAPRRPRLARWKLVGFAAVGASTVAALLVFGGERPGSGGSSKPDPAAVTAQARARLIQSVAGVWDRQDRSCAQPITVAATTWTDGVTRIAVNAKGFTSSGQVIAADNGVILSRNTTATASGPREQWEYHPNGDAMTVIDKDGVATILVRCPAGGTSR